MEDYKSKYLYLLNLNPILEKKAKRGEFISKQLFEYMGFQDEYLITKPGLMKLNKNQLTDLVLEQRGMIRKLIDDLEPDKRDKHIDYLDELYTQKGFSDCDDISNGK